MLLTSIDGGQHDKVLGITGAAFFVISDFTLAVNKFVPKDVMRVPHAKFAVGITYFLGQWLIFHSVAKPAKRLADSATTGSRKAR